MIGRMRSLRAWLTALWLMLLASAAATGYLLYEFYVQSAAVQVGRGELAAARACRDITDRFAFFAAGWQGVVRQVDDRLRGQLRQPIEVALARHPGVEGGIWTAAEGPVAYAFPTYEGTGPKTDVPSAELETIRRVNGEAARDERPYALRQPSRTTTLVVQACPLRGPIAGATAWTMLRVHTDQGPAYRQLVAGFAFLCATVVGSALGLGLLLRLLSRRIGRLQAQLGTARSGEAAPTLEPTGLRELDGLVDALNAAGERLGAARERASAAERLAGVGRLAAGVAHEIRNPLAAILLKAENALASEDPARARAALRLVQEQVGRMDRLLSDLLALGQPRAPQIEPVDPRGLARACLDLNREVAAERGVRLRLEDDPATDAAAEPVLACDPHQVGRALDNLVLNAIQNAPAGSEVRLEVAPHAGGVAFRVWDAGPGVPDALRERLFEPFVTGRAEGSGLGLAIVREIARAHGGGARLVAGRPGTTFELDLPWQRS